MAYLYFLTLLLWCVFLPLQFLFKLLPVPFYTQRRCLSQGKSRSSACAWFWACCLRPLFRSLLRQECRGRTCPVGGGRQIMNVFCWHFSLCNQFKGAMCKILSPQSTANKLTLEFSSSNGTSWCNFSFSYQALNWKALINGYSEPKLTRHWKPFNHNWSNQK